MGKYERILHLMKIQIREKPLFYGLERGDSIGIYGIILHR